MFWLSRWLSSKARHHLSMLIGHDVFSSPGAYLSLIQAFCNLIAGIQAFGHRVQLNASMCSVSRLCTSMCPTCRSERYSIWATSKERAFLILTVSLVTKPLNRRNQLSKNHKQWGTDGTKVMTLKAEHIVGCMSDLGEQAQLLKDQMKSWNFFKSCWPYLLTRKSSSYFWGGR